jgi:hypothetical protein
MRPIPSIIFAENEKKTNTPRPKGRKRTQVTEKDKREGRNKNGQKVREEVLRSPSSLAVHG